MSESQITTKTYLKTFVALLLLLGLTIGLSFVHLGPFHSITSLAIAIAKAILVMIYFMHLRYGTRLTLIFAGAGFYWLIILLLNTMADYVTRSWLPMPGH